MKNSHLLKNFKRSLSQIILNVFLFVYPVIVAEQLVGFTNFKVFIITAGFVYAIGEFFKNFSRND